MTNKSPYAQIEEALEGSLNGLKWYQKEYPDAESDANYEMYSDIKIALTNLHAIKSQVDVNALREALACEQKKPSDWVLILQATQTLLTLLEGEE